MDIYERHQKLVLRKFTYGLTSKEQMRLKNIRWQADRIEIKQLEPNFERLDQLTNEGLDLARQIDLFIERCEN